MAIIDDASRMIVGCDIFFEDNYINFMSVLKGAVKKYGKPKLLNVDNGSPYKNNQISLLTARLGITLHHCEAYTPQSKAKIERWNRTMKDHFMFNYHISSATTIEEVRADLLKYVVEYNKKEHSELKKPPHDRFYDKNEHHIYLDENLIHSEKLYILKYQFMNINKFQVLAPIYKGDNGIDDFIIISFLILYLFLFRNHFFNDIGKVCRQSLTHL